jgi:hypothetical protein
VLFFLFVAVSSLLHSVGIRRWHAHTHKVYSLSALYLLSICSFFSICFFGGVAGRVGWVLYLSVLIIMLFFFFLPLISLLMISPYLPSSIVLIYWDCGVFLFLSLLLVFCLRARDEREHV